MSVLALIPARTGSKGIKDKNFRLLAGRSLMNRAIDLCNELRGQPLTDFYVSSDIDWGAHARLCFDDPAWSYGHWILRPAALAQDDTPMIAVVQHALQQIPGQPNDIIVLLQPTQPLRKPEHVQQAIALLQASGADSVVSVVPLPLTHHRDFSLYVEHGRLHPYDPYAFLGELPTRRQDVQQTYKRDGTVYAFLRSTVRNYRDIYGHNVVPLLIDPADSCELDTEHQWAECVRRWEERHGG